MNRRIMTAEESAIRIVFDAWYEVSGQPVDDKSSCAVSDKLHRIQKYLRTLCMR